MATMRTGHVTGAITTIIVSRSIVEAAAKEMPKGRSKSNVLVSEETCERKIKSMGALNNELLTPEKKAFEAFNPRSAANKDLRYTNGVLDIEIPA
ncbi:unnamed protein product [Dovyalis caffra]|uniref:Uncharacterized protein n=1 Tax=Dovyalis caffra TaxID=77055 RepID=A0AAV1SST2_9ROSI|nr:unnamed protein product [Dovyalis caffra]